MEIHLFYNIAKLLYSYITKRNYKFFIYEFIGVFITILIVCSTYTFCSIRLNNHEVFLNEYERIIIALGYSILFFSTGILSRYLSKSYPDETITQMNNIQNPRKKKKDEPPLTGTEAGQQGVKKSTVYIGIVDFVWLLIMAIAYGGLIYVVTFETLKGSIPSNKTLEFYKLYYDETKYLFQESLNVALVLGTVLAGCMAILWGEAIWKKKDSRSINNYKGTTISAIRMVIGFFIIILSELFWISLPLFNKMTEIKNYIN
jgi:hypothetical protein